MKLQLAVEQLIKLLPTEIAISVRDTAKLASRLADESEIVASFREQPDSSLQQSAVSTSLQEQINLLKAKNQERQSRRTVVPAGLPK